MIDQSRGVKSSQRACAKTIGDRMEWKPIGDLPAEACDGRQFAILTSHGDIEVGSYEPIFGNEYKQIEGDVYRKEKIKLYDWSGFNNFDNAEWFFFFPDLP